jgi:uncharacterized protein YcbX
MSGLIAGLFRHPVKGFTPEAIPHADLTPDEGFPFDRVYAVEDGPCGFDPGAPAFVPKQKFTVLARLPQVAAIRTRFHEGTQSLEAEAPGAAPFSGALADEAGRAAFAGWLAAYLGDAVAGPLKVLAAPLPWRFTDNPRGQVSVINLESVRALSRAMGVELDPLRFRGNLYVEGWPAWAENGWVGEKIMAGWARAEVFKTIVRCTATHVDPDTAQADLDVTRALFDLTGEPVCGIYLRVTSGGRVSLGDACAAPERARAEAS